MTTTGQLIQLTNAGRNSDQDRVERALKRSILKRDNSISQFTEMCKMGSKLKSDQSQKLIFTARLADIDRLLTEFHTEQDSILDHLLDLGRDSEFSTTHAPIETKMLEQYYSLKAIALEYDLNSTVSDNVHAPSSLSSHIQLPKIKLPSFDGDLTKWCSYRDTFNSLVHENSRLTNIEKFHYLISTVSGMASSIVCALPLTDTNYTLAWEALHDAFDNKRLLITNHLDIIFRFTPMSTETLTGLKLFLTTFQENIAAITALEVKDFASFLLFYIASRVLPISTKRLFEIEQHANDEPDIMSLLKFIQTRCQILQNTSVSIPIKHNSVAPRKPNQPKSSFVISTETQRACSMCNESHFLYHCLKFEVLPVHQKFKFAQSHRLCMNCLSSQHRTSACNSIHVCRHCSSKHHSLLHLDKRISNNNKTFSSIKDKPSPDNKTSSPSTSNSESNHQFSGTACSSNTVVLGTAVVRMCNNVGQWIPVRVLIDSGSQVSVITNACLSRLGLKRRRCANVVVGLSQTLVSETKGLTTCTLKPLHYDQPIIQCEPIILSKIVGRMPVVQLNSIIRTTYSNLKLADDKFDIPGEIDFLLGADVYSNILTGGGRIIHNTGIPSAYETVLGWIVTGQAKTHNLSPHISLMLTTEPSIDQLLQRFWEIEEPTPPVNPFTNDDKCEELFCQTTTRDPQGRYIVSFPFHTDPSKLGESYNMALSRFYNIERKLLRNPQLYEEYRNFMSEYEQLGHMKLVSSPGEYFIPHHAVVKHVGEKMKLRVVFDASAKTSTNISLNQLLFVGKKLQSEITDLIFHCRFFKYMFTADICKMYRQIEVSVSDRKYQHILWRDSPSNKLCEYELCTVTYGVTSSPFQAIRVLHQLESDEGHKFPHAKNILSTQSYVDDILTGANTINDLTLKQNNLIGLLQSGGFSLKKWASNCSEILNNVPNEDRTIESLSFDPKDDSSIKILGLHWDPSSDVFSYHTSSISTTYTKRIVLSYNCETV